ncbi:MAG: carboxypeptidase-like regulatory domain-containing protein [Burkholderiales bacterium]|nr:carboxypeptidase-like regulatory domain-containing protein [Flavobacterium sp.]
MKKIILSFFLLFALPHIAQVRGTVTDDKGNPLPSVTVFLENTYTGTATNEKGQYELKIKKTGDYTLVFQYLGFKTKKINVNITTTIQTFDVQLAEENFTLKEVVINKKDNPANAIIKNAIASKKENTEKTGRYEADFYSRGIFRIKGAPKKIMGQKFDIFDEVLDSTRSGILYLSETVSKISFQKPDKLKETIIASKVSGNDNGFSFNNAAAANFDFYDNYIPLQINVVSPIADNAFNYYKYKLEGSFFNENKQEINKIKVIPRRISEPVMEGYIYIVDDSWAIYAVDLNVMGSQIQNPALNNLTIKQSFTYNKTNKIWVKNSQTLNFTAGILSIQISGGFTYVYSDYVFKNEFAKRTFTREVLSFEDNANKKDSLFWSAIRPVPLTNEETTDYLKKDLLQTKKKSKTYLDSIDAKNNKFGIFSLLTGYRHNNSFKKTQLEYTGFLKGLSFNTVQGWAINSGFNLSVRDDDKRTYALLKTNFNYGFAEEKLRTDVSYTNKFSNLTQSEFNIAGGSAIAQLARSEQISPLINTFSTLFFKDNYMKLYERNFASLNFKREIVNGIVLNANLDYSERKPLRNHTDYVILKAEKLYTSNNPLLPYDFETPAFQKHNLIKAALYAKINFGQEYWSRPDGKFNLRDDKYPVVQLGYEKGFAGSEKKYEFDFINTRINYEITLGNKGNLEILLKGGKFFNSQSISFTDYYHPNGNQTHVGQTPSYLNIFNLLPYYVQSTNDAYFEAHAEHNDKGYIMNKIPLLNKLKATLVLGYHNLSVPNRNPYHEFTIGLDNLGFGKFRFFRFDYIRSYQNGYQGDGIVFGLKFLNVIQ